MNSHTGQRLAVCIPARFGSKRLPGKLLKIIGGKTILQHVVEKSLRCVDREELFVLAGDTLIEKEANRLGVQCILTSGELVNGTERVASVLGELNFDYFVNIQADDPTIPVKLITSAIENLRLSTLDVITAIFKIRDQKLLENQGVVKVVVNATMNRALYFSRQGIPLNYHNVGKSNLYFGHIGIYGYKRCALEKYMNLRPTVGETLESLEQLRFLENDIPIGVFNFNFEPKAVDLPEDLEKLQSVWDGGIE